MNSTTDTALQIQIVLGICFQIPAGMVSIMCIFDHFKLGRTSIVKKYLLFAQLCILIFTILFCTVAMIETFYYNNAYLTVLSVISIVFVQCGIIIIQICMLRRSLVLCDKTIYIKIFTIIYILFLMLISIPYDVLILAGYFITLKSNQGWWDSKFWNNIDSLLFVIYSIINFIINCSGNYFLFKYYLKQRNINNIRNDFIDKIAGRRLRLILFATFIEIFGMTFLILLASGYIWAAGGSILILGTTLQGKLLLLFIDDDLDITFLNNTPYCTSVSDD